MPRHSVPRQHHTHSRGNPTIELSGDTYRHRGGSSRASRMQPSPGRALLGDILVETARTLLRLRVPADIGMPGSQTWAGLWVGGYLQLRESHLAVSASDSCGLQPSATWVFGDLATACAMAISACGTSHRCSLDYGRYAS